MYKQILAILTLLLHYHAFAQSGTTTSTTIGERTFHFTDKSRNRPVVTEVWYPTDDTSHPLPLIMLSHGTGGGRLTLEWLAQFLAHNGFIVAAVDHWGNTYDNKIPLEFLKAWERPQDISFALTSLLADNTFKPIIDQQRIGAIGFSFGGYTVITLAGGVVDYNTLIHYYKTIGHKELELPELPGLAHYLDDSSLIAGAQHVPILKDRRIKAFFAISPALGPGFTQERQFKDIDRPIYIIGSQSDSIAPIRTNAYHFHQLINGSGYYEFPGKTGHYVMLGEAIDEVKRSYPTYFADDPSVNRHQVHQQVDELALNFFKQHLLSESSPQLSQRQ